MRLPTRVRLSLINFLVLALSVTREMTAHPRLPCRQSHCVGIDSAYSLCHLFPFSYRFERDAPLSAHPVIAFKLTFFASQVTVVSPFSLVCASKWVIGSIVFEGALVKHARFAWIIMVLVSSLGATKLARALRPCRFAFASVSPCRFFSSLLYTVPTV